MAERNAVPRVWAAAIATAWAVLPEKLPVILEIAARENELDIAAIESRIGKSLNSVRPGVSIPPGTNIALVSVEGVIFPRASLFSMFSGGASCDDIARDFTAALDDDSIGAIVLNIDSPGGDVNGVAELAGMIYAARQQKPILAYVRDLGASAAYWVAAAASEIIVAPTAQVGSIGVVGTVANPHERGTSSIEFVSSQSPNKRPDPTTDLGKQRIQARIDALANVFINTVAEYRGVTAEHVVNGFGQGDVFVGQLAVDAGLADAVGSLDSVVAKAQRRASGDEPAKGVERQEEEPVTLPLVVGTDWDDDEAGASKQEGNMPLPEKTEVHITMEQFTAMQEQLTALTQQQEATAASIDTAVNERVAASEAEMNAKLAAAEQRATEAEAQVLVVKGAAEGAAKFAAQLQKEQRNARFMDEVRGKSAANGTPWSGEFDAHVGMLETLADAFGGEESEQVQTYIRLNRATAEKIAAMPVEAGYAPIGNNTPVPAANTAAGAIEVATQAYMKAHGVDYNTAYIAVIDENPMLFDRYNQEHPSNPKARR